MFALSLFFNYNYRMNEMKIALVKPNSTETIKDIYNFNVKAFADSQDFSWTEDNIKKEMDTGWSLRSVHVDKEIICALFMKKDDQTLLTKNTPLKLTHQGNGYSHQIKDFYEDYALEHGLNKVVNYCPEDNFRMVALNESHKYEKTGSKIVGNVNMIEWEKKLK